ncbi:hypothetical protein FHT02_000775 [Sphingomonas xinjiangensis]|uniref:Uncharacterized protein n=1 Tax=Sphingomonas xinjiangensis TaxID=643568 RepID=A0A840YPN8_9SPHN|nr:hypothetical protein [Sphingomonas xinjiangensis]
MLHQCSTEASALKFRINSHWPDHYHRHIATIVAAEHHRPALDSAEQLSCIGNRGEAKLGDCGGAAANLIRGAAVPVRPEGTIKQILDAVWGNRGERYQAGHTVIL